MLAILAMFFTPTTALHAARLADFDRLAGKVGTEVYVVDVNGLERVGRLAAADASALRLKIPSGELLINKLEVTEVDRRRDSPLDGTIKGLIYGAIMAAVIDYGHGAQRWLGPMAIYGGVGFLIDNAVTNREPLYRAHDAERRTVARVTW
jgi:hypothetical protein